MTAAEEIIRPAQLIELYKIGFKLVPLDEDGKPALTWTDIYENVNYWNPDRLVQESYRFNNVATTFGKTHLKDLCIFMRWISTVKRFTIYYSGYPKETMRSFL